VIPQRKEIICNSFLKFEIQRILKCPLYRGNKGAIAASKRK